MDVPALSLLLTALLLVGRAPDSTAVVVLQTGGVQLGPSICPGSCRCGVINTAGQQRVALDGAADGVLARQRRFVDPGERVRNNIYPWLATVTRLPPFTGFNAAALISDRHVLTAASAVAGVPRDALRVTLGVTAMCGLPDNTAINISVAEVALLADTSSTEMDGDDLALLLLASPVRFSTTVRPVCLPPTDRSTYLGRNALVVGFGGNDTLPLVATMLAAADNVTQTGFVERCRPRALLQPVVSCAGTSAQSSTTGCVGSPGVQQLICPKDAGSLVQVRGLRGEVQLIGIVSNANNCTEGMLGPAQFTLTAPNLRWLLRRTTGSCFCAAP